MPLLRRGGTRRFPETRRLHRPIPNLRQKATTTPPPSLWPPLLRTRASQGEHRVRRRGPTGKRRQGRKGRLAGEMRRGKRPSKKGRAFFGGTARLQRTAPARLEPCRHGVAGIQRSRGAKRRTTHGARPKGAIASRSRRKTRKAPQTRVSNRGSGASLRAFRAGSLFRLLSEMGFPKCVFSKFVLFEICAFRNLCFSKIVLFVNCF
ncbi:hypothetical protein M885DRAFT_73905 [Pelagophyceae sp. CCMP2097]|nr:hypothetical protein M885DRAFT_73905 [Pelagophyceae sp. CCMP2097]